MSLSPLEGLGGLIKEPIPAARAVFQPVPLKQMTLLVSARKIIEKNRFEIAKYGKLSRKVILDLYFFIFDELNSSVYELITLKKLLCGVEYRMLYIPPVFPENLINFLMKKLRLKKKYGRPSRIWIASGEVPRCLDRLMRLRDLYDAYMETYKFVSARRTGWLKGSIQLGYKHGDMIDDADIEWVEIDSDTLRRKE